MLNLPRLWRPALVGLTLAGLLLPPSRLPHGTYAVLFGVPLAWAGFRKTESHAFRWWAAYALGFVAFALVRGISEDVGFPVHTTYPIVADRILGFGVVPTVWLQAHAYSLPLAWFAIAIHMTYYAAPPLIGLYIWRRTDRLSQYVVALLIVYAASIVLHILVPTVPPWLAAEQGALPPEVRRYLYALLYPEFYQYGTAVAGGNPIAAMPSVHVAAAVVIACAVGWPGWTYAALMTLALVYMGEHYLIDAIAGGFIALAGWRVAGGVVSRRA